MATSVRDLPGLRLGARVHAFVDGAEDAYVTRVEDLDDDWIAISVTHTQLESWSIGVPIEMELPQAGGSVFLGGTLNDRRVDLVPLAIVRIEHVGADPQIGSSREQRRHFRQSVTLPLRQFAYQVELPSGRGWEETNAVIRDLSAGGASAVVDDRISPGTEVRLTFPMPFDGMECSVHGTVLLCEPVGTARHRHYRAGIRFDDLTTTDRQWLTRQLHRFQTASRR